ncbi:MAG: hypothetical protein IJ240_11205 [Clostridia bacterium]|nr:hypothetical protein [Clostridia bacterium]
MNYYLGMDIGGTNARIEAVDEAGQVIFALQGRGGTPLESGVEVMRQRLRELILPALERAGLTPGDCRGLVAGAAGIDTARSQAQYAGLLSELGFDPAILGLFNDCELLLAALPTPGAVLIGGTGSIAAGRAEPNGEVLRAGGWSHLLSDEGSGTYIATQALRALVRYWDGREDCPLLAELIRERTGLDSAENITVYFHGHITDKDTVASLAPVVGAAAEGGDPVAQAILLDAAGQLYGLLRDDLRKLRIGNREVTVLLWGSVLLKNLTVQNEVLRRLRSEHPAARPCTLETTAVHCAARIACGLPTGDLLRAV